MATPDETVEANLANPARVRIANQEVEQHSLADQIAAAKYLAESSNATAAATQAHFGLRFTKLVPPGAG